MPETNVIPGEPGIIVNLAGEGESVGAVDVNNLIFPLRPPASWVTPGRFICADITALPIRDRAAISVLGRRLPQMDGRDRDLVAAEAFRIIIRGGDVRLHATSGGGLVWLPHLLAAGFDIGTIEGDHARGVKP